MHLRPRVAAQRPRFLTASYQQRRASHLRGLLALPPQVLSGHSSVLLEMFAAQQAGELVQDEQGVGGIKVRTGGAALFQPESDCAYHPAEATPLPAGSGVFGRLLRPPAACT